MRRVFTRLLAFAVIALTARCATAQISNEAVFVPLNGNLFYDVCTSSQHLVAGSFDYNNVSTTTITVPNGACLLDNSLSPLGFSPVVGATHTTYTINVPSGTGTFSFFVDFTNIDCFFFANSANTTQVTINTSPFVVDINRPILNAGSPFYQELNCIKGRTYTRSFRLTPGQKADYHFFELDATIEAEILITSVRVTFTINNVAQPDTTIFIHQIVCSDLPDSADQYLNTTSQLYSLSFSSNGGVGLITIPTGFDSLNDFVTLEETFVPISTSGINPSSSYVISANNCQGVSSDLCLNAYTPCSNTQPFTLNIGCNNGASCVYTRAGDPTTPNITSADIDVYDVANNTYHYRISNQFTGQGVPTQHDLNRGATRFYGCQFHVNLAYWDTIDAANIIVATWVNGAAVPLTIQPSIQLTSSGGTQAIYVCFKDITADPDGPLGPFTNVYTDPTRPANDQYFCDLPANNHIIFIFNHLSFNGNADFLHDCNFTGLQFMGYLTRERTVMSNTDLCLDDDRQIFQDTTHARCSPFNAHNAVDEGAINSAFGTLSGNTTSTTDNTDIVVAGSQNGATVVNLSFTYTQTNGVDAWALAGPRLGCGNGTFDHDSMITSLHTQSYYAHIEIPPGFRIVPGDSAIFITDGVDSVFSDVPFYNAGLCNAYDIFYGPNIGINATVGFAIQLDGCPSDTTDFCDCSQTVATNPTFGFTDFCVQFRTQLTRNLPQHQFDAAAFFQTYACASRQIFYHCSGPCGSQVSLDTFNLRRNSFGWPTAADYLANNAPLNAASPNVLLGRAYIGDQLRAYSEGVIQADTACHNSFGFEIDYESPGGVDNVILFDSARVTFSVVGGPSQSFALNGSNVGTRWDTTSVDIHQPINGNSYLATSVFLSQIVFTNTLSLHHYVNNLDSIDVTVVAYYHLDCDKSRPLAPDHYDVQQIRSQYVLDVDVAQEPCHSFTCDPFGDDMDICVLRTDTRIGMSGAAGGGDVNLYSMNLGFARRCAIKLALSTETIGGYNLQDDFPNEYRPIVVYPNSFDFDISNNLYLSRAYHRRMHFLFDVAPNGNDNFFDLFNLNNCPVANFCPAGLSGGPLMNGGNLGFVYSNANNNVAMNGNTAFSEVINDDAYWRTSEKGDTRWTVFELTRSCINPAYTTPFTIDSVNIPIQYFNTQYTTNQGNTAVQCVNQFDVTNDPYNYVNSNANPDLSFQDMPPIALSPIGAPYTTTGNQVTFCADFNTQGVRTGWIRCVTPGAQIVNIFACNTCPVGCTANPMLNNGFGLFYFDCDPNYNQRLMITINFTCDHNNSQGYDPSLINLEYGVFCNRCTIGNLNPANPANYATLTGCAGADTTTIQVTPVAATLVLTEAATASSYAFCSPAVIDVHYELTAGAFTNGVLHIVNSNFGSVGEWYVLTWNGDTIAGNLNNDTLEFPIDVLLNDAIDLEFTYFPGCASYNDASQDFSFFITGTDGCGNPLKFIGNTVSDLTFLSGSDPFISMVSDTLAPFGCNDSVTYTLHIAYATTFTGNIILQACPQSFFATGSVTSNYPFNQSACIDWIIPSDPSGVTTVELGLVTLDGICDGYDIPVTIAFESNCYDSQYCNIGLPHSILSSVNVCCDTCHYEFELDDLFVCDGDTIPCIYAPAGYTFTQITHDGTIVATSGTVYCPTGDGEYIVTIAMCGCTYTDTFDVVTIDAALGFTAWLSDSAITFCDTVKLNVVIENTGNYPVDDLWLNVKIPAGYSYLSAASTYACAIAVPPAGSLPSPTGMNGAFTYWDLSAVLFAGNGYPAPPASAPIYLTLYFVPPSCTTGTKTFEAFASGEALPCDSSVVSCKIKPNVHVHSPATTPTIAITGPASLGCNQTGAYQYVVSNISPLFTGTLDFQICLPAGICNITSSIAPSMVVGNCYYWFIPVSGITSYTFNFNLTSCNFQTCQNYTLQTRFDMKGEIKCCPTCTPCPWETAFMYLNKTINVCCCNYQFDLPATVSVCANDPFPCYTAPAGYIITQVYYNWLPAASNVYTYCPSAPGTYCYKIKHLATGCQYSDCTVYQYVECPCDLKADWKANQDADCSIQFDDVSTMSTGTIIGWFWDFGDGATSTLPDPYHVYQQQGSYTVCLTVYGLDGKTCCQETYCQEIFVVCEPGDCKADAKWYYQMYNCDCALGFGASTAQAGLVSYYWDFGDGTTSTEPSPDHIYAQPGTYDVCLTVVAIQGDKCCTDRYCEKVEALCGHGQDQAMAAAPEQPEPCADCPCNVEPYWEAEPQELCSMMFHDVSQISSGTIVGWFWDFGDGTTSTDPNPTHVFAQPGSYNVCLTVVCLNGDQCCFNNYCKEVWIECEVSCKPEPWMEYALRECNCFIYFEGHNSHPSANAYYFWDFGDGFTSTEQNPVHGYLQPGAYTVCLTIVEFVGDECCVSTKCEDVWVECGTGKEKRVESLQTSTTLSVAPNPFDEQTRINFTLSGEAVVTLRVVNLLGEVVRTIYVDQNVEAGLHTAEFSTDNLPAGVYVCELNDGRHTYQVRMIVQR